MNLFNVLSGNTWKIADTFNLPATFRLLKNAVYIFAFHKLKLDCTTELDISVTGEM
jgi:hypothetical protein